MLLHEINLHRQKCVDVLARSQEQRAAVFSRFNRAFCSSIGLHRIPLVRVFKELLKTVVVEYLETKRADYFLGEHTRPWSDPPRPASPRRPAVRRPDSTRPWYIMVLDSIN